MFLFKTESGQEIKITCDAACAILRRMVILKDCFEELAEEVKTKKERETFQFCADSVDTEMAEFVEEMARGGLPRPPLDPSRN